MTQVGWELGTIRFHETVYDLKTLPHPQEQRQTIHTMRCMHQGRLGVAVATEGHLQRLQEAALAVAPIGPLVSNDLFREREVEENKQDLPLPALHDFVERLHENLRSRFFEHNFVIKRTRRELITRWEEQEHVRQQDFFDYIVLYRQEKQAPVVKFRGSSIGEMLTLDAVWDSEGWMCEPLPAAAVAGGEYEAIFAPGAFDHLLERLLGMINAEMLPVLPVHLRVRPGERLIDEAYTIDLLPRFAPRIDEEGVRVRAEPLLHAGRFQYFCTDRLLADRHGLPFSGNGYRALRPTAFLQEALPLSQCPYLRMQGGSRSKQELIDGVRRGIWIEEVSPIQDRDFLYAPVRLPVLKAWVIENGRVCEQVKTQLVLRIDLLPFFQTPAILSHECKQVQGRELPWVYLPKVRVL